MSSKADKPTQHHARILIDTSAWRKVLVIPNRIDLSLGVHEITWTLEDKDGARIESIEFKPKRDGERQPVVDNSGHSATLCTKNNDTDDDVDRRYVIRVKVGDKIYGSEPHHWNIEALDDAGNIDKLTRFPGEQMPPVALHIAAMTRDPVIRNHPI
ncbi:MAG: hypothetical protein WCD66_11215 [Rhodanobacteraceae bacterium]